MSKTVCTCLMALVSAVASIADEGFVPVIQPCINDIWVHAMSPNGHYAYGIQEDTSAIYWFNSITGTPVRIDGIDYYAPAITDEGMLYGSAAGESYPVPAWQYPEVGTTLYYPGNDPNYPAGRIVWSNGFVFVADTWSYPAGYHRVTYWMPDDFPAPRHIEYNGNETTALAAAMVDSQLRILFRFQNSSSYEYAIWYSGATPEIRTLLQSSYGARAIGMSLDGSTVFGMRYDNGYYLCYWNVNDESPIQSHDVFFTSLYLEPTAVNTDGSIFVGTVGISEPPYDMAFYIERDWSEFVPLYTMFGNYGFVENNDGFTNATMSSNARVFGGKMYNDNCDYQYISHSGFLCKIPWFADANDDQSVNEDDLDIVLFYWGTTQTPFLNGDVNGDGTVGQDDLDYVLYRFGINTSP